MHLYTTGVLADVLWLEIPHRIPFVELGSFVVMRNNLHGILTLNNAAPAQDKPNAKEILSENVRPTASLNVMVSGSEPSVSLRSSIIGHSNLSGPSPRAGTISTIIRSYKSALTRHTNRLGLPNGWQSRFHDHIIPS
jgi:hypothetical protein